MITATTPTSAGFAQVFDTSGLAQADTAARQKKRDRFEKNIKEFDSGQVWYRDIPEFTNKTNKYYKFMSDNYDKISNKSRNLDTWYEMKSMEGDLANFVVSSKAMGQMVDKASKLMLDKPDLYDNQANQDLIDGQITGSAYGGLAKGYATGEAHNSSFMKNFNRNIQIDTDDLQKRMQKFGTPNIEKSQIATISGRRKSSQYKYDYDLEGISGALDEMWKNGYTADNSFVSSADLQRKYGNFEEFAEVATSGLPEYTDPKEFTEPSESDGSNKANYQWQVSAQPSGTRAKAQHTVNVVTPKKKIGVTIAGKKIGLTTRKERTTPTTVPYVFTPASNGNVDVYGTKSVFKRKAGVHGGWDMRDNKWSETNLTDDNLSQLTNVDNGFLATSPIFFPSLTMKDDQGKPVKLDNYTAVKGSAMSQEMINAIDAGGVSYVDENGENQPLSRDTNVSEHIWQGAIAYSRNASYASGFDISNSLSYMNSLTGKQYRSIAEPWDEYKHDVQMSDQQRDDIERELAKYDVQDHFDQPISVVDPETGELDYDKLDELSRKNANANKDK